MHEPVFQDMHLRKGLTNILHNKQDTSSIGLRKLLHPRLDQDQKHTNRAGEIEFRSRFVISMDELARALTQNLEQQEKLRQFIARIDTALVRAECLAPCWLV